MSRKREATPERIKGLYSGIPVAVMDSPAFIGASHRAKALLFEVMRQHTGSNNGHLQLAMSWLKKRGWPSADQVNETTAELIERNLIVQTRQGGLNIGPSRFALSWHHITNYVGLDIHSKDYQPGRWALCYLPPTARRKPPQRKRESCSEQRNGADPVIGIAVSHAIPTTGTKTAISLAIAVPTTGNNERLPIPPLRTGRPVVGAKGRSGKPGLASNIVDSPKTAESDEREGGHANP